MKIVLFIFLISAFSCSQSVTYKDVSPQEQLKGREEVRAVIRQNRSEVKDCFDMSIVNKKAASGQVNLSWVIDTDGKADQIKILSNTVKDDGLLANCLKAKLQKMKFKKSKTSVEIDSYPFVFSVK